MVGKMISKLRRDRKMTQDELAEKINVTRQAISNWENEKTEPDIETLGKLSEIFGCSVEYLIYGREPKTEPKFSFTKDIIIAPSHGAEKGIGFGAALAMIISYAHWHSIGWAILHGLFNWVYVIYYIIKY